MDKTKNLSIPDIHPPIYFAKSLDGKRVVSSYKVEEVYYTYEYLGGKFAFLSTTSSLKSLESFLEKFVDKKGHAVQIPL